MPEGIPVSKIAEIMNLDIPNAVELCKQVMEEKDESGTYIYFDEPNLIVIEEKQCTGAYIYFDEPYLSYMKAHYRKDSIGYYVWTDTINLFYYCKFILLMLKFYLNKKFRY